MKKIMAFILSVIMVFALIGCGNGNTNNSSSDDTSAGTSNTIKIGVSLPLTGNSAESGAGMSAAIQLAADEWNAKGGIDGKEIELTVMDSKADAKECADVARIFTGDPEIVAVLGDFNSACSLSAAPIYQEAGLVMLNPTASHPDIPEVGDYIFASMGRQSDEGPFMAIQCAGQYIGAKKVGIIYANNDWGVVVTEQFVEAGKEADFEVVAQEPIMDGEKDFTTALNKIRQANPDLLVLMLQHTECAMAAQQVRQMGWDVALMTAGASYTEQLIDLGGDAVEGIISESPFIVEKTNEECMKFSEAIYEKVNFMPGIHAAGAYDAANMLFSAIDSADSTDRTNIRDALATYKGFSGLMGPIEFDEVGGVHRKYRILTVENGEWVALTNYDYY